MLFEIRKFANITISIIIYFAIFYSHINSTNLILAQNSNAMRRNLTSQKMPWEL